ncbi:MAG TPA: patatin-like phospholipase family protein [Chitinophagaceae bacterium]|nr:patatin-like phospholipase family protein [Chitinophagaceae bacterium]
MSSKTKYFQNCLGVFQGGGVKAIAFAGAYEEAILRGVFFSQLIGTSAGSIIAALIGAGASPNQLNEILAHLDFSRFLSPPLKLENIKYSKVIDYIPNFFHSDLKTVKKYMRYLGEYDASYIRVWLDEELRKLLGRGSPIKFRDLYIPTSVVTTDIKNRKIKVWDVDNDPDAEVALAVQTSCSIPFYFQPYNMQFVDGGLLSNLPSFKLNPGTIFDKILAFSFSNEFGQTNIDRFKTYFRNVMEAAIDGAVDLQLQMQSNIHLINSSCQLIGEFIKRKS